MSRFIPATDIFCPICGYQAFTTERIDKVFCINIDCPRRHQQIRPKSMSQQKLI